MNDTNKIYKDNTLTFSQYLKLLQETIHEAFFDVRTYYTVDPFKFHVEYKLNSDDKKKVKVYFNGDYIVDKFCEAARTPLRDYGYMKTITEIVSNLF